MDETIKVNGKYTYKATPFRFRSEWRFLLLLFFCLPPQYNGNISSTTWQVAGRDKQAYAFTYDDLDRLLNAKYMDVTDSGSGASQTSTYSTDNKYEEKQTYDLRGNILTLQRNGMTSGGWNNQGLFTAGNFGQIDNLSYTYNDQIQLVKMRDYAALDKGFKLALNGAGAAVPSHGASDPNHYTYDANGNIRSDMYKGITYIWYNHLNLPTFIILTIVLQHQ